MTERTAEIIRLINREVKPALGCTEPIAVALAAAKAVETLREGLRRTEGRASEAKCSALNRTAGASGTVSSSSGDPVSVTPGLGRSPLLSDLSVAVEVSANILKNGMGVGIPGVRTTGLLIAAALGAVCGRPELGLEVLHDIDPEGTAAANRMVDEKKVRIDLAHNGLKLYVKATVRAAGDGTEHCAEAVIEDEHDNIVLTAFDGEAVFALDGPAAGNGSARADAGGLRTEGSGSDCGNGRAGARKPGAGQPRPECATHDLGLTVREIFDFASTADFDDIKFILESKTMNLALAEEGLRGDYGLKVGKTIMDSEHRDVFGDDFISYAMALTAAATDARMAGCTLPAMSNSGSGNQGVTVTMPVIAFALRNGTTDEQLARALILSHLVAIHIKSYLGRLSALCGCVVASTGSSCGLVYLNGGGYEQVCSAIKNMIGNIMGMVCDGAKCGCALKVASGVSGSIQSAVLALDGICISENDGIIDHDIERTIANLGRIGSVGMQATDDMILDIMVCK